MPSINKPVNLFESIFMVPHNLSREHTEQPTEATEAAPADNDGSDDAGRFDMMGLDEFEYRSVMKSLKDRHTARENHAKHVQYHR